MASKSSLSRNSRKSIEYLITRVAEVVSASGNKRTELFGVCAEKSCGKEYRLYVDPRLKTKQFCTTHRAETVLGVRCLSKKVLENKDNITRFRWNGINYEWFARCPKDGCKNDYLFHPRRGKLEGQCKLCAQNRTPYKGAWMSARNKTQKTRGFSFNLSFPEYVAICKDASCFYCSNFIVRDVFSRDGTYLDRLDSTKGYIAGNCVPCCVACNKVKAGYIHQKEMLTISLMRKNNKNEAIASINAACGQGKTYDFRTPNDFGRVSPKGTVSNTLSRQEVKEILRRTEPFWGCWKWFKLNTFKLRGIAFYLTFKQYRELSTDAVCFYCKEKIMRDSYARGGLYLDRIDSSKSYFQKNCVPCCVKCNMIKAGWLHHEELKVVLAMRKGQSRTASQIVRKLLSRSNTYSFRVPRQQKKEL